MNDDKRHARLDSLLADYAYTSANDWDDYNELKRKAEIADALEEAFKQGYWLMRDDEVYKNVYAEPKLTTIATDEQELLEWAKGVE